MPPSGQGALCELGQSTHCKGQPRCSTFPWQSDRAAVSTGCCVQLAASPVVPSPLMQVGSTDCHSGKGHNLCWDFSSSGGMPSLCAGGPSWFPVCHVPLGIARTRTVLFPTAPLCSPPPKGEPPTIALTESPFCLASGLCTFLVSVGAQTCVLAQNGISPLRMLPLTGNWQSIWFPVQSWVPRQCCNLLTEPVCGHFLQPCGWTLVGSLLGGGLSLLCCCQMRVPGHQACSMLHLLHSGLSLFC